MYKLEIGILSDTQKKAEEILTSIYRDTITPYKIRGVDWCVCDGILYSIIPEINKGLRFDQIVLDFSSQNDDTIGILYSLLSNSCVPLEYQVLGWYYDGFGEL